MALTIPPKKKVISDINVVPFIDIMLVLLIIFMVTAPLMFNGIKLQLPRTGQVDSVKLTSDQIILSYSPAGDYFIGETKVLFQEIVPEILSIMKKTQNDVVFVRADFSLQYGKVAYLMSHLKKQGISKIALVTEIEK
jgi:biopolymer transport protein TolR